MQNVVSVSQRPQPVNLEGTNRIGPFETGLAGVDNTRLASIVSIDTAATVLPGRLFLQRWYHQAA